MFFYVYLRGKTTRNAEAKQLAMQKRNNLQDESKRLREMYYN